MTPTLPPSAREKYEATKRFAANMIRLSIVMLALSPSMYAIDVLYDENRVSGREIPFISGVIFGLVMSSILFTALIALSSSLPIPKTP